MTTEDLDREKNWREEFISRYCNDHDKIRWLRSIFFDEEEKLNTILDFIDEVQNSFRSSDQQIRSEHEILVNTILETKNAEIAQIRSEEREKFLRIVGGKVEVNKDMPASEEFAKRAINQERSRIRTKLEEINK